jgi:phosphohistidine phosphatase SixA
LTLSYRSARRSGNTADRPSTGSRFAANGLVEAGPFFWLQVLIKVLARSSLELQGKHRVKIWRALGALACSGLTACAPASEAGAQPDLWDRLAQGGYVLLLPHASAPSAQALPPQVATDQCARQDHLSEQGRSEAQQLGEKLRNHSVSVGRVMTSHDCRCIETAAIVFGKAEPWSVIDHVRDDNAPITRDKSIALREAISRWASSDNLALVSHQGNIEAALGVITNSAQVLVIEPLGDAGFRLLGSLPSD